MKRFLYLTVCFFILGKFYGCNGDVFVDDFRSSDSELTLDGNGDVATIQFAAANWDWMYVAFDFPIQYNIFGQSPDNNRPRSIAERVGKDCVHRRDD